jgi:hypothetical protein
MLKIEMRRVFVKPTEVFVKGWVSGIMVAGFPQNVGTGLKTCPYKGLSYK